MKRTVYEESKSKVLRNHTVLLQARALCISILNDIRLSLFREMKYLGGSDL
ncbi:hypothetical protein ABXV22_00400 [Vibrio rotiferianus]|uniref:hypothetical protein n=1 Tax=Vibrio rotiferianus TaxID=190895 RepID=UPI0033989B6F